MPVYPTFQDGFSGAENARRNIVLTQSIMEQAHQRRLDQERLKLQVQQVGIQMARQKLELDHQTRMMPLEADAAALRLKSAKTAFQTQEQEATRQLQAQRAWIDVQGEHAENVAWIRNAPDAATRDQRLTEMQTYYTQKGIAGSTQGDAALGDLLAASRDWDMRRSSSILAALPVSRRSLDRAALEKAYPGDEIVFDPATNEFGASGNPNDTAISAYAALAADVSDAAVIPDPVERRTAMQSIRDKVLSAPLTTKQKQDIIAKTMESGSTSNLDRKAYEKQTMTRIEQDEKRLDDTLSALETVVATEQNIDVTLGLLDVVDTGRAADLKIKALEWAQAVGITAKDTDAWLSNAQALRKQMGDFMMARVAQTKGAVSEKEMAIFEATSPNLKNTTEGNRIILRFAKMAAEDARAIRDMVLYLREQGTSAHDITRAVNNYKAEQSGKYRQLNDEARQVAGTGTVSQTTDTTQF